MLYLYLDIQLFKLFEMFTNANNFSVIALSNILISQFSDTFLSFQFLCKHIENIENVSKLRIERC